MEKEILKTMREIQEDVSLKKCILFEISNELKESNEKIKILFEQTKLFLTLKKNFINVNLEYIDEECITLILDNTYFYFIDINIFNIDEENVLNFLNKYRKNI